MQIFISHSSMDKPIARKIKINLEERGISAWLDEAEIRVGESIPEKISEAINGSHAICILFSKNSVASRWVKREMNAFLPFSIKNKKTLIPCKLDDSEIPAIIADIKYADFTNSIDFGISEILHAFRIHEEICVKEKAKQLKDTLLTKFTHAELAYTLFRIFELDNIGYHVGDRRTQKHPYKLLDKLQNHGVFTMEPDKYERDYLFTPEAKEAIIFIYQDERELICMLRRKYES